MSALSLKSAALTAALAFTALPAAAETISVSFTQPDGGVTTGLYSGIVQVTVSGTGQSASTNFNDAFYIFANGAGAPIGPTHDSSYYQLTFGLSALIPFAPAQDAVNAIIGGLPAYNPSHVYTFLLNTGAVVASALHFGVSDGNFSDNTGSYSVTVTQPVPEPVSMALFGAGLLGLGLVRRRRG